MNDRFKFRVWNKEQNRFHHSFCCDITASGTLVISQGIEGKKYIVDDDNYVVQQCTGLKDKNGKLIFEGDVIKYYFDDDNEDFIVKYSEKDLAFITETLDGKYQNNFIDYDIIPTKEYEIIGNTFENKELLNEI